MGLLQRLSASDVSQLRRDPVDSQTLQIASEIVEDVRAEGIDAVCKHAERLGDISGDDRVVWPKAALDVAVAGLPPGQRELLERVAARIRKFAQAQRDALSPLTVDIPGGQAGHEFAPVQRAGCYAPGGRFPLPSSVLMTVVTARVAGVESVWVASPKPTQVTLAAAAIAGADGLLAVGGAQAIGALAFGAGEVPACDVLAGPGNRWVTAAKHYVSRFVGIDMLAGPSELVVLADDSADPGIVAADLLAQAEHDPDALPVLITTSVSLVESVERELTEQLAELPTRDIAKAALVNGFAVVAANVDEAIESCDRIAPEHLEVHMTDADEVCRKLKHWGGLFVGVGAAEVFGDYGVGPNHVLPTGGCSRFTGGLSVLTFLRMRTWIKNTAAPSQELIDDTAALARLEGLHGHATAAERRSTQGGLEIVIASDT